MTDFCRGPAVFDVTSTISLYLIEGEHKVLHNRQCGQMAKFYSAPLLFSSPFSLGLDILFYTRSNV